MKTMPIRPYLIFIILALAFSTSSAQTDTIIALQSTETAVETGQYYSVNVYLQDASDIWQIDAGIEYDPSQVYVRGTVSGSPMSEGDFFASDPSIMIRNASSEGTITYTHSLVAPADLKSGSGVTATFEIYPLSAGTTQIRFKSAELTRVHFTEGDTGNRDVESTEKVSVVPALLELTITGETVPVPDEATPTPEPTATTGFIEENAETTAEPTLVNITLAPPTSLPDEMPTLIPDIEDEDAAGIGTIVIVAIGLLLVGALGVIVLIIMSRRR